MTYSQIEPGVWRRLTLDVDSRSARCTYVDLLDYSNATGTDGVIPRRALRRVCDADDPEADVAALVEAGFLVVTADGWEVPDWTTKAHQQAAAVVDRRLAEGKDRAQRWRDHQSGSHATCRPDKCSVARDRAEEAARVENPRTRVRAL